MPTETAPRHSAQRHAATRQLLGRVGGFGSLAAIGAVSPLVVLPVVARAAGPGTWVALGVGQSIGAIGAALVILGWAQVGQSQVALAGPAERAGIYARSLVSRLPLAVVALPASALVAVALSPGDRWIGGLMAVATAVTGLSASWFFVGTGSPASLLLFDTGPRVLAALAAAVAILLGASAIVFPLLLLAMQLVGIGWWTARTVTWATLRPYLNAAAWWADLRGYWQVSAAALAGTAVASLPLPLASRLGTVAENVGLVSADRLYRYLLLVLVALANGLQAWVVVGERVSPARARVALATHLGFGTVVGLGLAIIGPTATRVLFGVDAAAGTWVLVAYGLAYVGINLQTVLSRVHAGLAGRWSDVLKGTSAGIAVGLPAMVVLGLLLGPVGVAFGFAVLEVGGAVALAVLLRRS